MYHHAYLLVGPHEEGMRKAHTLFGFTHAPEGNPDVHVLRYSTFGIEEARVLTRWAFQQPVAGTHRIFIVQCEQLTHETQNALLKLFEEPPRTSRFALLVPSEDSIIATLRSRFEVVPLAQAVEKEVVRAEQFLAQSYAERLEEIARRTKSKEEGWHGELLSSLEDFFHTRGDTKALQSIAFVRTYSERRGASRKMLLEHLALSLPSVE